MEALRGRLYRHKKTGGVYEIVRIGRIEATLQKCVVYENALGDVWVRPLSEFCDGRFEPAEDVEQ